MIIKKEICLDTLSENQLPSRQTTADIIAACRGGADSVELCENLSNDGFTPDSSVIREARDIFQSKPDSVWAMIRPPEQRSDFSASKKTVRLMASQIKMAKNSGADGVVLGILKAGGSRIDIEAAEHLIGIAKELGIKVTFHRAIDAAAEPLKECEKLLPLAFDRILTSGLPWGSHRGEGRDLEQIVGMVEIFSNQSTVVIGGGVTAENVGTILDKIMTDVNILPSKIGVHAHSGAKGTRGFSKESVARFIRAARQRLTP